MVGGPKNDSLSETVKDNGMFTVAGTVTQAGSYCGGAAPSDEMLAEVQRVRPMSGFMIYVKKGKENNLNNPVVDSVFTNSEGKYTLYLPKGDYVLLQKNQLTKDILSKYENPTQYLQANKDCLEKWWKAGLTTVSVQSAGLENINFHFQKRCFVPDYLPCLNYTGPYPP